MNDPHQLPPQSSPVIKLRRVEKYRPAIAKPPAADLEEAKRIVLQIVDAFTANFQNTETDLAHMITDKFVLREPRD